MIPVRPADDGCSFQVRLQPRARKPGIQGTAGEALKVAVHAPPVEGRANEELVEFLADVLKVPRRSVTIASGERGRSKTVRVRGLAPDEALRRLRTGRE